MACDFDNHKRLVCDIAVGSNSAVVFMEYTPIPDAVFPTQLEESYAAEGSRRPLPIRQSCPIPARDRLAT
ncbi:hypothetical protein [Rhizobium tibeticum]|uniref:hypothetical protein n=1 Tax=Rhizobium tibeticum TaxID=501024 RepID=UPI003B967A8B